MYGFLVASKSVSWHIQFRKLKKMSTNSSPLDIYKSKHYYITIFQGGLVYRIF